MKIVVIGGTGLIGSKVVAKLAAQGHEATAAAPSTGVDTVTGAGLAEAFAGATVVVDLANSPSFEEQAAMEFFRTAGKNIVEAEVAGGVQHHVALSVVGSEQLTEMGYFKAKLAQEEIIRGSPIPYTLLRATQFFEFVRSIAQSATEGDVVRLPHSPIQPMAAEDVATAVAAAALAGPTNGMCEIAGPEVFFLDDLVARVLEHDRDPRKVVTDPEARYFGIRLTEQSLVPGAGPRLGSTRLDWWLVNVPPPPQR